VIDKRDALLQAGVVPQHLFEDKASGTNKLQKKSGRMDRLL